PVAASAEIASWYGSAAAMAVAKIVGFVVTPTTSRVETSSARLPERMRPRERSSSQMLTPRALSWAVRLIGMGLLGQGGARPSTLGRYAHDGRSRARYGQVRELRPARPGIPRACVRRPLRPARGGARDGRPRGVAPRPAPH